MFPDDCVRPRTPVAQPDDDDSFHVSMQDPFAALQDLREKAQSLTDSSPARGKRRLESSDESSSRIVKTPRVELVADVSSGRKLPQREDTDVSKPYVIVSNTCFVFVIALMYRLLLG